MAQKICDCGKDAVKDTGFCSTCQQKVNEQIEKELNEEYILLHENTMREYTGEEILPF